MTLANKTQFCLLTIYCLLNMVQNQIVFPFFSSGGSRRTQGFQVNSQDDQNLFNLLFLDQIFSPSSDIASYRQKNFQQNARLVNQHNQKTDKKYILSTNQLSFLSFDEFQKQYLALIPSNDATLQWASKIADEATKDATQKNNSSQKQEGNLRRLQQIQDQTNKLIVPKEVRSLLTNFLQERGFSQQQAEQKVNEYDLKEEIPKRKQQLEEPQIPAFSPYPSNFVNNQPGFKIRSTQTIMPAQSQNTASYPNRNLNPNFSPNLPNNPVSSIAQIIDNTKMHSGALSVEMKAPNSPIAQNRQVSVSESVPVREPIRIQVPQPKYYQQTVDWSCISGQVVDQGKCGSCYAQASNDAYSMMMGIYLYTIFYRLSTQEVLQCAKNGLTLGCSGGLLEGSYVYMHVHGIVSSIDYPYSTSSFDSAALSKCDTRIQDSKKKWRVDSFRRLTPGNCLQFIHNLQKHPFSIGLAVNRKFQQYSSGVFDDCDPETRMNHAVVLIGFQIGKGWKIKNSWGTQWGQKGYAWLNLGNTCRICELGVVVQPSNKQVKRDIEEGFKKVTCPLS